MGSSRSPGSTPLRTLGASDAKPLFHWKKTKDAWYWVNSPGVLMILLLFPSWETQAPREQPLRKLARKRSVFPEKMHGRGSWASLALIRSRLELAALC